jgi:DNA polymerase-4
LIIGGGDRGVVASCSYEARTFGGTFAMPIKMALDFALKQKVMKGDMELYSKLSGDRGNQVNITGRKKNLDEFY